MKPVILAVLFIFVACTEEQNEKTDKEIKSYITNELSVEEAKEKEQSEHKIRMNKKKFVFSCTDNCGSGEPSIENLKKYKTLEPFDIKKTVTSTNYIIEFRFIDDCCLEFVSDIVFKKESLELKYWSIETDEVCECHCEYGYKFEVERNGKTPLKVKLHGKEI